MFQQVEVDMFRMAALFVVERLKPWLMTYLASLLATVAPTATSAPSPRPSPRAPRCGACRATTCQNGHLQWRSPLRMAATSGLEAS